MVTSDICVKYAQVSIAERVIMNKSAVTSVWTAEPRSRKVDMKLFKQAVTRLSLLSWHLHVTFRWPQMSCVYIKCSPVTFCLPQVQPHTTGGWLSIKCFQAIQHEMIMLLGTHIFFMAATDVVTLQGHI